jgi:hypothetical protein
MKPRLVMVIPPGTPDLPLTNVEEVGAALAITFNQVRRGELDVRVGNCLGLLAAALLRAYKGDPEVTVTLQPARVEPPLLTEELKQKLLREVRERRAACQQIGLKELPGPVQATGTNGESINRAG